MVIATVEVFDRVVQPKVLGVADGVPLSRLELGHESLTNSLLESGWIGVEDVRDRAVGTLLEEECGHEERE